MLKLDRVADANGESVAIRADYEADAVYTAEQSRELDRLAMTAAAIPGISLMRRAGAAAFALLRHAYPDCRAVLVVCGGGNNGGDGYVVARLARQAGMSVRVRALVPPESLRGDAAQAARDFCEQAGRKQMGRERRGRERRGREQAGAADNVNTGVPTAADLQEAEVIVDAIFGTGLTREAEGDHLAAIHRLNQAAAPTLALDLPSGLHADSGRVMGAATRARHTATFIGVKPGLLTGAGPDHCGELALADLGLPPEIHRRVRPQARVWTDAARAAHLPPRPRTAHKGAHGHVLLVGGDYGFLGAIHLAARAALRSGAGLVTVASREEHARVLALQTPELMTVAARDAADLAPAIARANCVVIGPGLGRSAWAAALLQRVLACERAVILDADALNLLAADPASVLAAAMRPDAPQSARRILTPHPGEAARLLACDAAAVQADRFAAATALQGRYGGVIVLKGAGTIIVAPPAAAASAPSPDLPPGLTLCRAGNPGMASGGMGDVLSGVIAGLAAQGLPAATAAGLGVYIHGTAADQAARAGGERGMAASDLSPYIRRLVNP